MKTYCPGSDSVYSNDVVWVQYFFRFFSVPLGMCESGESWAEVPELFCQVLEEDDSVKQCALLKKVLP